MAELYVLSVSLSRSEFPPLGSYRHNRLLFDFECILVAKFVYWSNKAISAPSTTSIYIKNQIFTSNKRRVITHQLSS
jgi:hypothetical protein